MYSAISFVLRQKQVAGEIGDFRSSRIAANGQREIGIQDLIPEEWSVEAEAISRQEEILTLRRSGFSRD
jgi:hypothetical protein